MTRWTLAGTRGRPHLFASPDEKLSVTAAGYPGRSDQPIPHKATGILLQSARKVKSRKCLRGGDASPWHRALRRTPFVGFASQCPRLWL